jgi:hypothetical protein
MKSSIKSNTRPQELVRSAQVSVAAPTWQATFSKRLPHRIGQPLSSGGGGDGCGAPAQASYTQDQR